MDHEEQNDAVEKVVVVMAVMAPEAVRKAPVPARSRRRLGEIVLLVAALAAAGMAGWVIRGDGDVGRSTAPPAVSMAQAGHRYLALAGVVNERCVLGYPDLMPGPDPMISALGNGRCAGAVSAMATALREGPWPEGATDEAAALAVALDDLAAYHERLATATSQGEYERIYREANLLPRPPWDAVWHAVAALRDALEVGDEDLLIV